MEFMNDLQNDDANFRFQCNESSVQSLMFANNLIGGMYLLVDILRYVIIVIREGINAYHRCILCSVDMSQMQSSFPPLW